MKGLAAILTQQKSPLAIEEIECPRPKLGQVMVKLLCSGICGAQLGEIDGVKGPDKFLPHLLGHEGTGLVVECGEGVRHIKPGDKVVLHWRKGSGLESIPATYLSKELGPINSGWVTTFNQYATVSENRLTPIPQDFDPEIASLLGCAVTTAFGVLNNDAHLRIGESIAIFGAGGVGLNIVQGAALAGAHPIIATDLFDNRLDLARKLGATHTFNANTADLQSEIPKIIGRDGVDVAIDNTGNVKVIELAYKLTHPRGRTILVGVPPTGSTAALYTLPLHFEKHLHGSHGGSSRPELDIPHYVRLVQSGKLRLDTLIGQRYPLDQINRAIEDIRSGHLAGRAILRLSDY